MSDGEPKLLVKIVSVDYYLSKPIATLHDSCYSRFRSLPVKSVPVIRIFGPTSEGIKTCVHVHGVFPYIFIPNWKNEILEKDLYFFAVNLDKAINTSFVKSSIRTSYIYQITVIPGRPFYGYYESDKDFLKIEFYNPAIIKHAIKLLQNGAVLNKKFQPYEAHIPYILQFFIDNNLHGMNNLMIKSYETRNLNYDNIELTNNQLFNDCCISKQSYCELEVDIVVDDILNKTIKTTDNPNNPGIAFIWEEEKKLRRYNGRISQITLSLSQDRPECSRSKTELYYKKHLEEKILAKKEFSKLPQDYQHHSTNRIEESNSSEQCSSHFCNNERIFLEENQNRVTNDFKLLVNSEPSIHAEDDSILGDQFSNEENELDESDHIALSQPLIYSKNEIFSSDDEIDVFNHLPQLDGANDHTPSSSNIKSKCKKSRFKSRSETNSSYLNSRFACVVPNTKTKIKRTYNLRSKNNDADKNENMTGTQKSYLKITNKKSDLKYTSPKKPYPQLKIDTQKSPKSTTSNARVSTLEFKSPSSRDSTESETIEKVINENSPVNSKRLYPPLNIVKNSPKTTDRDIEEIESDKGSSFLNRNRLNLKRRRINFECSNTAEENKSDSTPDLNSMSLMTNKWKKPYVKLVKLNLETLNNGINKSENQTESCPAMINENSNKITCLTTSQFSSQKYSLKIYSRDSPGEYLIKNEKSCIEENDFFINLDNIYVNNRLSNNVSFPFIDIAHENQDISAVKNLDLSNELEGCAVLSNMATNNNELLVKTDVSKIECENKNKNKLYSENSLLNDNNCNKFLELNNMKLLLSDLQNSSNDDTKTSFLANEKTDDNLNCKNTNIYNRSDVSKYEFEEDDENLNNLLARIAENVSQISSMENKKNSNEQKKSVKTQCLAAKNLSSSNFQSVLNYDCEVHAEHFNCSMIAKQGNNFPVTAMVNTSEKISSNSEELEVKSQKLEIDHHSILIDSPLSPELELDDKKLENDPCTSLMCDRKSPELELEDQKSEDEMPVTVLVSQRSEELDLETESPNQFSPDTLALLIKKKYGCNFSNSIWDSLGESYEDERILSFYDGDTAPGIKSPAEKNATSISSSDTESSPIAKVLSFQSEENEIMSFYDSESPVQSLDNEQKNCTQISLPQQSSDSHKLANSPIITKTDSDSSPICSPILHSTPQYTKQKKSPSPTYTPILKKLMIKKVTNTIKEENNTRRRSLRFQAAASLPKIKEEEEKIHDSKNTSVSLLQNSSAEVSENRKSLNASHSPSCNDVSCQIDGVTLSNKCGFKMNLENLQDIKIGAQYQFVTVISMEMFPETRENLNPDPEHDEIKCLFFSVFHDAPNSCNFISGVIIVDADETRIGLNEFNCQKIYVQNENELFDTFISIIRQYDPDMFLGYEVEMLSWGYFIQRGRTLRRNCEVELSRVKPCQTTTEIEESLFFDESDYTINMKLIGRIVLNIWRLMRHEVSLQSYTFENIIFHVLHQRIPKHSFKSLLEWWKNPLRRWLVVDYYLLRVEYNIALLQQLDFFGRTSELARLFGIQFYEVLSRGSQFRVESMMLRLAKAQNYIAVSPNTAQRAAMRAPESLPLIMEPESKFYVDPVIVLDFQSLYPSIIIAYNYCFSTCLGRVEHLIENETFEFGCIHHTVPSQLVSKLEPSLNISPCGVAFVNQSVRKGILPSMLEEILETRLMVKKSMKENKENSILQRVLHARQLGLKLIANVTYGYTSANFSGRMPCIEVGDSVVSKGRETLERAIELITNTEKWAAKVIYGDTDSIFVLTPNRTKEEAFQIGAEIVEAVTNDNPKPIKLKLEKVYLPCILQTKKRYVGYMYENCAQKTPVYDAKGIETVRRDGCPAISKILEKSLKLLFETKNVSLVKQYVQRQFTKIMSGRINIQELTFAREYRGINNYKPTACVPALLLAKQALMQDKRAEPRIKERVPYVIVAGPPGVPLIQLVRTPQQFLETSGSVINSEYYITRAIIPALERCFNLLNENVKSWYADMPRRQKLNLPIESYMNSKMCKKKTISHYFVTSKCIVCQNNVTSSICKKCAKNPQQLALILGNMINTWQQKNNYVSKICKSCCGRSEPIECVSLDCPLLYVSHLSNKDTKQIPYICELQQIYLRPPERR